MKVHYTVSRCSAAEKESWTGDLGHICEEMLKQHLPERDDHTLVFVCGPDAMIKAAVLPALKKMGFDQEGGNVILF